MKRYLSALALLALSVAAPLEAAAISWTGVGWYAVKVGFSEDEEDGEPGYLELSAGPYSQESACQAEADRRTAAEAEYMVMYFCRHVDRPPKPTGKGKILIWSPG
ncbi:MAG TPA: hypothetical protein VF582_07610 [Allosphingosinicella sp.]|jgi:hypothetical protein